MNMNQSVLAGRSVTPTHTTDQAEDMLEHVFRFKMSVQLLSKDISAIIPPSVGTACYESEP